MAMAVDGDLGDEARCLGRVLASGRVLDVDATASCLWHEGEVKRVKRGYSMGARALSPRPSMVPCLRRASSFSRLRHARVAAVGTR